MWGRQGHPLQRAQGQITFIHNQKSERFYSGEKLTKILICDMGVGPGCTSQCPPRWHGQVGHLGHLG